MATTRRSHVLKGNRSTLENTADPVWLSLLYAVILQGLGLTPVLLM